MAKRITVYVDGYEFKDKIIKRKAYRCGKCKRSLSPYYNYCPNCGEVVEKEETK